MDMQDKEFDKLFRSKFDDFEVEPSSMVWDNITGALDDKKAKRSLMPWLSIAASLIVLVTAGTFFLKQKETVTRPRANSNQVAQNHTQHPAVVAGNTETDTAPAEVTPSNNNSVASITKPVTVKSGTDNGTTATTINTDYTPKETETSKADNPQLIAAVIEPAHEIIKETAPDKVTQPTIKTIAIERQSPVEKPVIAAVNNPAPQKKHGIRSLGGLVNVLVAAVDKRQDKLIEFSESDDDDTQSTLTGVNLGLIKIKKQ